MNRENLQDLLDPALYLNRELAQLEFNFRVLAQAQDSSVPLLERLRYLCISCTNLDEFFEVRVAVLKQHSELGELRQGPDALAPSDVLARIRDRALTLVNAQYEFWNTQLLPQLEKEGVRFSKRDTWDREAEAVAAGIFPQRVSCPCSRRSGSIPRIRSPRILNKSLNLALVLKGRDAFGRERPHGAVARAALAAAHHSPAGRSRRGAVRLRVPVEHPARVHG